MKQTAVQSFWDKIALKLSFEQLKEFIPEFNKAKEMEKEQIIEARIDGDENYTLVGNKRKEYAQQYYNETYEKDA